MSFIPERDEFIKWSFQKRMESVKDDEEYTNSIKSFEKDGYVKIPCFLPLEAVDMITQYTLFQAMNNPDSPGDGQVPGTFSQYSDSLMETLLQSYKHELEMYVGRELIPTYSYYRVYKPGDVLEDHKDRPACELSATVTLGYKYNGKDPNYRWPLHVYVDGKKRVLNCEMGDAIMYKGCEVEHGRDKFNTGPFSYQVQVFLHYVDANGPYAKEWAFDKRPSVGIKRETIDRLYGTTDC